MTSPYRLPRLKIRMVRDGALLKVSGPNDAAGAIRALTCADDPMVERFVVLFLDGGGRIVGGTVVAQGGRHGVVLTAVEVLRPAIVASAATIILGHNHPSGDPSPSSEDLVMTEKISQAGLVVGIQLVDHVIVTDRDHHSMMERKQMSKQQPKHTRE